MLFPFAEYWWFYGAFIAVVLGLLALDLGVFHRTAKPVSFREAMIWTLVWISLALLFNVGLYAYSLWKFTTFPELANAAGFTYGAVAAKQMAMEFLTGFVVEKSLAVDNIFLFAVVFGYFAIPVHLQHRVLFYGILGALVFRSVFIALGSYLMAFHSVHLLFGALLILTGIKMMFTAEKEFDVEHSIFVRLARRLFPIEPKLHGDTFFVRKSKVLYATPLFLALVVIEFSDIVFAIDSVPAIFALTKEPLIVFTSNIFAILGLRSMYFMLAGVMQKFAYMKYGLASVLVFVGVKMTYLNGAFGGKFPIAWSLGIIAVLIGSSILASIVLKPAMAQVPAGSKMKLKEVIK
jgi:tellurite resistance protein TerC